MRPEELYKERAVKLIAFSVGKRSFPIADAINASGMGHSEFLANAKSIYANGCDLKEDASLHEIRDWHLKPEALFSYIGLKEFEHSIKSARDAKVIAIISIIISGLLAIASIFASIATN